MPRLAALLILVTCASSLEAQRPNARRGFWFGLGVGTASFQTECSTCSGNRIEGPGAMIRVGGTASAHFLLGVEIAGWSQALGVKQSATYASFIITPFLQGLSVAASHLERNGAEIAPTPETRLNLGQLGIGPTWH